MLMLWGWKKLLWERNNSNGFWYLGPFVSMFCSAWWKMSLLGIIRHWSLPRHQYGGCYVNNVNIVNIIQRNNCFPGEIEEWGVRSEYWRLKMVGMVELWLVQVNMREVFNSNLLLFQDKSGGLRIWHYFILSMEAIHREGLGISNLVSMLASLFDFNLTSLSFILITPF